MKTTLHILPAQRLRQALSTWPDRCGWRDSLLFLFVFTVVALPFGFAAGLLHWQWSEAPVIELAAFAAIALVVPCLAEELLFRALLTPHRSEPVSMFRRLGWGGMALVLFVAWHPVNGWLLKVSARAVFFDPAFLTLAAMLGIACTLAYWRTGSIWPAVAIHWITVVVWKLALGGRIIPVGT